MAPDWFSGLRPFVSLPNTRVPTSHPLFPCPQPSYSRAGQTQATEAEAGLTVPAIGGCCGTGTPPNKTGDRLWQHLLEPSHGYYRNQHHKRAFALFHDTPTKLLLAAKTNLRNKGPSTALCTGLNLCSGFSPPRGTALGQGHLPCDIQWQPSDILSTDLPCQTLS